MGSYINSLCNGKLTSKQKVAAIAKHLEEEKKTKDDIDKGSLHGLEKDRIKIAEDCKKEYPSDVWEKLTDESKQNLKNAYVYSALGHFLKDNESGPIHKMGLTVEYELRDKIFIGFINGRKSDEANETNETDKIILNCVKDIKRGKEPIICLTQMLITIKESNDESTESNYAYELYDYLKEKGWDVNDFYSEGESHNFYLSYPSNYRNPSSHTYVVGEGKTFNCKKETLAILKWFLGTYNGAKESKG